MVFITNLNFVQERRKALDKFKYDDYSFESTLGERETRPLTVMENGARYTGEWVKNKQVR